MASEPSSSRSYLEPVPGAEALESIVQIRQAFGFAPNFFLAQGARPDLIEAELHLIGSVMMREGALTRQEKEYIFLVCSAANLSTYCLTAHCEIVRILGIQGPEAEQIAIDYTDTDLPMRMKALLRFAAKLNSSATSIRQSDVDALRKFGFVDEQVLEAILMVGVARFANTVSLGLGVAPDFDNPKLSAAGLASRNNG